MIMSFKFKKLIFIDYEEAGMGFAGDAEFEEGCMTSSNEREIEYEDDEEDDDE